MLISVLLVSYTYSQDQSYAKGWKHSKSQKKGDKWQRKAAKQDKKAKRTARKMVSKRKSKGKISQTEEWKHQDKMEQIRAKEKGMIYKGRSKRHIKVQDRKTKRRMRKSLKKHRKLNR